MDTNLNHDKSINKIFGEIKSNIDNMSKSNGQKTLSIKFTYDNVSRSFKCEDVILKAHDKTIRSIIETSEQKLISAGYDYTMKIWEEGNDGFGNKNTIKILCGAVTCLLQLKDERILSSSASDNNIKVWVDDKKGGYDLRQSLTAHNKPVTSMVLLNDSRILTGSIDLSIIVWKENSNEFVVFQKIIDQKRPIMKILNLFDNQFVFCTDESVIKFYGFGKKFENINDTMNESFIFKSILKKHTGRVNCLCELKNHYLVSGGAEIGNNKDHYINIWKPLNDSFSFVQTLRGHQSDINTIIQLQDGRIASASKDRTIRIWKMETNINGNNVYIEDEVLSDYGHGMYCLIQLSDGRLCSTSSDNAIVIWRNRTEDY
jgi:WD40 repeat protein